MEDEIIKRQRDNIVLQLDSLINKDCILTDLPYHNNIGDIAIWQGELDFLKDIRRNIISQSNSETFSFPKLNQNVTILLHGGGNFGDLYRGAQEFRRKMIHTYPNNRIIVFPQSIWYEDKQLIEEDARAMSLHKDLYICARDITSFEFLKKNFGDNHILLVPDMAFCIHPHFFEKRSESSKGTLMFIRTDKELDNTILPNSSKNDVHDWPTFEKFYFSRIPCAIFRRIKNWMPFTKNLMNRAIDFWYIKILRPLFIMDGLALLSGYRTIVTTRLHAMILGIHLGKRIRYIDNTTGKLSAYANCWLKDASSVKPFQNE